MLEEPRWPTAVRIPPVPRQLPLRTCVDLRTVADLVLVLLVGAAMAERGQNERETLQRDCRNDMAGLRSLYCGCLYPPAVTARGSCGR